MVVSSIQIALKVFDTVYNSETFVFSDAVVSFCGVKASSSIGNHSLFSFLALAQYHTNPFNRGVNI